MPDYIKSEHISRMFPFEFYNELSEKFRDFVLLNPAFIIHGKFQISLKERKSLFDKSKKNEPQTILNKNNISNIEPLGEVLTLEPCCSADDVETVLYNKKERTQIPITLLVAQLYDSSGAPVFSKDVTEETIERIPEVLFDDPNLLLAYVSFLPDEARVAIVSIPEHIEAKMLEPINETVNKKGDS